MISRILGPVVCKCLFWKKRGRVGGRGEGVCKDMTVHITRYNPKLKVNPPVNFIHRFQGLI